MLIGRPFGEVMTLVNKRLRNLTETICCEERFVIIKIADYLCVNIYLPCTGSINRLSICEAVLYDVCSWLERYPNCPFIIAGDFNANLDNINEVSHFVNSFIVSHNLVRCDTLFPPANKIT